MEWKFSWWLLLPLLMSVFYSYTEFRAKIALELPTRYAWLSWSVTTLAMACLTLTWSTQGFSLPLFYIVAYILQAARLMVGRPIGMKNWFLLNLSHANLIATHLTLIGVAALTQGVTMKALLNEPFWRTMSVTAVMFICIVQDIAFLYMPKLSIGINTLAESEEAEPFMAFLWICVVYLLIDSTLCVFELEPLYPPMFLIGNSVVVMFTLIRFLLHIFKLIKSHHLKEEHDMLEANLEATEESADTLKKLAERDALTGILSRRGVMERIEAMVMNGAPFSLIFMDLDDLKHVNDTHGHDAGDAYLIGFARELSSRLRDCDTLARVGGDEFIALMPGCGAEDATERIQSIRSELEQERPDKRSFRFSYGVTASLPSKMDAELLIREADQVMYQDKARRHREEGRL